MNLTEEIQENIRFILLKIKTIREKNEGNTSLDIKDISDLQRYSETLSSISKFATNMVGEGRVWLQKR